MARKKTAAAVFAFFLASRLLEVEVDEGVVGAAHHIGDDHQQQHRLPRRLLQLPYDILNRINRRKLLKANTDLTSSIRMEDYRICPVSDDCFDLFYVAEK